MKKENNKLKGLSKIKNIFKEKIKLVQQKRWIKYGIVIIFSLALGAGLAFYQFITSPQANKSNPQLEKEINQAYTNKEATDKYQLTKEEKLSLPANSNKKEQSTKNESSKQSTPTKQAKEKQERTGLEVTSNQQPAVEAFTNLVMPVNGEILTAHQWYKDEMLDAWKFNPGMDIKAEVGTKVKAVQAGEVVEIIKDDYQGITVIIKHNSSFKTKYCHLEKSYFKTGQRVSQGQVIGEVGDSGLNKNNKIHFEIIKKDKKVSPLNYLK